MIEPASENDEAIVLVTGGTGYIASHIIKSLLDSNLYRVRTTVRYMNNEDKMRALHDLESPSHKFKLDIFEASFENENSWLAPTKDCHFVIHTASPRVELAHSMNAHEFVKLAEQGTLNVLKGCVQEGNKVRRVVLTSSIVAVSGDRLVDGRTYSETDWPENEASLGPYAKSKVRSEKAAWNFVLARQENNLDCFELTTINPGYVIGPILNRYVNESVDLVRKLMLSEFPFIFLPDAYLPTADVRDVALAHVRAMHLAEAVSNRHIIVSTRQSHSLKEWCNILREEFGSRYSIPSIVLPSFIIRAYSLFCSAYREKAKSLVTPIELRKTLIDTVNSLIEHNIIPKM